MNTIKSILNHATKLLSHCELPHLEAEILLMHILDVDRSFLHAHSDYAIDEAQLQQFQNFLHKRQQGEPMAYILGHKEFWSLDLLVNPSCLIPRPESELLVELVLENLPEDEAITIADLGTGSGAIALAVASERPNWKMIATDKNADVLKLAETNAKRLNINNIEFLLGSWCEPLTKHSYTAIISNPPYIPALDPHLNSGDLRFEPRHALVGGEDGLDDIRKIISQAKNFLMSNGWLFIEHGYDQGSIIKQLLSESGYSDIKIVKDYSNCDRVAIACFNLESSVKHNF